jgi:transposase
MEKVREILDRSYRLFIGIDVHLVSWTVTIRTRDVELKTVTMAANCTALEAFLRPYMGHPLQVVYEAGYFGYSLCDFLQSKRIDCVVTPPNLVPDSAGNRVKTDKKDSRKLAQCLSNGELKRVYVPTAEERSARMVSRRRRQLIADRVRVQHRIKAELRFHGITIVEPRAQWSACYRDNLGRVTFHDRWGTESFQQLLTEFDHLTGQIASQNRLLNELSQTDRYRDRVKLLRSIPGIGPIGAMEFLLELQDISRFHTAKALAAYLGLTPSQYSSGEHTHMGSITRTGKPSLRGQLVESAWILVAKDAGMRTRYERLRARTGGKRAIVAIARRLALIARRVLLSREPYQPGISPAV